MNKLPFVGPDTLWHDYNNTLPRAAGTLTFVYDPDDDKLMTASGREAHVDMMADYLGQDAAEEAFGEKLQQGYWSERPHMVYGRLGPLKHDDGDGNEITLKVIALWEYKGPDNNARQRYEQCFDRLRRDDIIDDDWYVSVGGGRLEPIIHGKRDAGADSELRSKLHTADSTTKKYIRTALGTNAPQHDSDEPGFMRRRRNWLTSEGAPFLTFENKLERALLSLD